MVMANKSETDLFELVLKQCHIFALSAAGQYLKHKTFVYIIKNQLYMNMNTLFCVYFNTSLVNSCTDCKYADRNIAKENYFCTQISKKLHYCFSCIY